MIIKHFIIDKVVGNNFGIFLFYGKNEGLQNEVLQDKFLNNFKGTISKYDETEFLTNYEVIYSEILSKSLFESDKIIVVTRTSDKIVKFIEEIISKNLSDVKIILKSGILEKRSKLRNLFEKNKKLYCVPFYEDDSKGLSSLAFSYLNNNKIKLSNETVNLLVSRASGNRENLKNELEKIINYSLTNKKITFEVIQKLSNLAENYDINELADSYLLKNKKKISRILNENNYSDEDCIVILRSILARSKRLLGIIQKLEHTKNIDEIISASKPPIFWKDKENVKKQANNWKIDDLKNKIFQMNDIEMLVKTNAKNSLNLISDFIINN